MGIQLSNLFRFIDEAGYAGWIGCEYKPSEKQRIVIGWAKPYL
jgi:hydroxypyruvate isomerase